MPSLIDGRRNIAERARHIPAMDRMTIDAIPSIAEMVSDEPLGNAMGSRYRETIASKDVIARNVDAPPSPPFCFSRQNERRARNRAN